MIATYTVARPLTDTEMEAIKTPALTGDVAAAIIATFDALLADIGSSWDLEVSIQPADYAIPEAQWLTICGWLTNSQPTDAIESVNLGLTWMNIGPSSYKPAQEASA